MLKINMVEDSKDQEFILKKKKKKKIDQARNSSL